MASENSGRVRAGGGSGAERPAADMAGFDALARAVDIVNALRHAPDEDVDRAALRDVLRRHGEGDVALTSEDVAGLREAVDELRQVFETDVPDAAAALLNGLLARAACVPYLSDHDGHVWHLHVTAEDGTWQDWLLASSALALAQRLGRLGGCAWGQCAAPSCTRFFVHDGRGGRRRYCSPRCATRQRVAEHRARAGT